MLIGKSRSIALLLILHLGILYSLDLLVESNGIMAKLEILYYYFRHGFFTLHAMLVKPDGWVGVPLNMTNNFFLLLRKSRRLHTKVRAHSLSIDAKGGPGYCRLRSPRCIVSAHVQALQRFSLFSSLLWYSQVGKMDLSNASIAVSLRLKLPFCSPLHPERLLYRSVAMTFHSILHIRICLMLSKSGRGRWITGQQYAKEKSCTEES